MAAPRPDRAGLRGSLAPLAQAAADADARWSAAYRDAAAGRYGAALAHLEGLVDSARPEIASAALRLRASVWRQLTRYERAERDGAAAEERLDVLPPGDVRRELAAAAATGRVADAAGRVQSGEGEAATLMAARLSVAEDALDRLLGGAADADPLQIARHRIRLRWVAGEVALTAGDIESARMGFSHARSLAEEVGARRHAAKSAVFLAASLMACGEVDRAGGLAADAAVAAADLGAAPLRWPALLVAAEAAHRSGDAAAGDRLQVEAAGVLAGCLHGLPEALHAEVAAAPPASWLLPLAPR